MPTAPFLTYSSFLAAPSRRDVYLYTVTVKDSTGTSQTLRWCGYDDRYKSRPSDSPANTTWEPRVLSGGTEYTSPGFDPFNPSWGVLAQPAPSPLVVVQDDADLDTLVSYRWPGARITVQHGGWTDGGVLPLNLFRTINSVVVDGWPTFDLDRVTIPLRSLDARFDDPVERRTLAGLGWGIEGDGASAGVDFYPFAPGVKVRGRVAANRLDSGLNLTVSRPEGVQDGDLMVVWIASHSTDSAGTYFDWSISGAPAGWTQQIASSSSVGGVAARRLYCYTKVAGASEALTYTFTGSGVASNRNWELTAWYGQDGTTPVVTSAEDSPEANETTADAPTVTSTRTGDVLSVAWATQNGHDSALPAGLTLGSNLTKNGGAGNRSDLKTGWKTLGAAGATGTQTIAVTSSRYCAGSLIIGNRASGGAPTKLDLQDALTVQFGVIPYDVSAKQHLFGWETSPFRVYISAAGKVGIEWKKATVTVNKESTKALEADKRYHVEIVLGDNNVRFNIYDWTDDTSTTETLTGTGFHGRDTYAAGEHYTFLHNYNGGTKSEFFEGQLWDVRVWGAFKSPEFLEDCRMRPLSEAELVDTSLIHRVSFSEKTGTTVGDSALAPADGTMLTVSTGPTTLSCVAESGITPAKITRASGDFTADGWAAGRCGIVSGFAKFSNTGKFQVVSASALELQVRGLALVAETGSGDESLISDDWRPTLTGTAEQVGQQVPCVFGGPVEGWPGLMVESSTDGAFFLVHADTAEDIEAIYEGGASRMIHRDYASYRDFVAQLPPPGTYTTYRGAMGSFYRARVLPTLPSTCKIKGDATGGTFVYTAADIARRVMGTRGTEPLTDPDDFVTASINTLNAAAPHAVGTGVGAGESIRDFLRRVLGTIGAVTWPKRDGDFSFKRFAGAETAPGSLSKTIHRKVIQEDSFRALSVQMPVKVVRSRCRRNWTPMDRTQISGDVTDPNVLAFLLSESTKIVQRRWQTEAKYTRSRTIPPGDGEWLESLFCDPIYAGSNCSAEATRLLDLFGQPAQLVQVAFRPTKTPTELFEEVIVEIQDLDDDGALRDRLGLDGVTMIVVNVQDDRRDGVEVLTLFRQDAAG